MIAVANIRPSITHILLNDLFVSTALVVGVATVVSGKAAPSMKRTRLFVITAVLMVAFSTIYGNGNSFDHINIDCRLYVSYNKEHIKTSCDMKVLTASDWVNVRIKATCMYSLVNHDAF